MEENKLQIDMPREIAAGTYSNLAIISHSPTEFILDFASIMPGSNKPAVRSRIIMAPEHTKRLLAALQDNVNKYETKHGQIQLSTRPEATFDMGNFGGNGAIS